MTRVANPILPGFHPDPCLLRVGDWYYLATSTFEWWPGVRIHRSRDLATWDLAGYALTRRSQLDLRGVPDSGGVWAPALSYAHGRFWLVYTNARSLNGPFKDLRNYLVTAPAVEGPWSEPVELNSSGFDPSLFHDDDGRAWLLNQLWRPSTGVDAFAGIVLQEYSLTEHRLIGEPRNIFRGSPRGITEGPHLYRRDGFYYLVTAEGGTSWNHAVTVARSRTIDGPYELSPCTPLLSASDDPANPLQKAGHASFVQTPAGEWFIAHLCSRPVGPHRRCLLGRETALQRLDWPAGDWPRLAGGGHSPREFVELSPSPGGEQRPRPDAAPYLPTFTDDFTAPTLDPQWNTLREPSDSSWCSLAERPGWLRLRGRHSLLSAFDQSLVGFRLLHQRSRVWTRLEFSPRSFQQSAGLTFFYNSANFYYASVSANDAGDRELRLIACDNRRYRDDLVSPPIRLPAAGAIELGAQLCGETLQFFYALPAAAQSPQPLGPALDATTLSDDYPIEGGAGWSFTGPFAALCAQDSGDTGLPADFDWFRYHAG